MISNYRFEDIEMQNSFEEGVTDMIYFPVTDSEDFPTEIREKTEEIIDHIIHAHKLDISKLRLNARIIVYSDANCDWLNEISVLISDYSAFDDAWIEEEYSIQGWKTTLVFVVWLLFLLVSLVDFRSPL